MLTTFPIKVFILAGGQGTRLRSILPRNCPKVLAPIIEGTFLDYLLAQLHAQGLSRMVFLLGHGHEMVLRHLNDVTTKTIPDLEIETSVEPISLGTGGALKLAERFCDDTFFLINGDVYFDFEPRSLLDIHRRRGALMTTASRVVSDTSRFGTLQVDAQGNVLSFSEKVKRGGPGLISVGVHAMEPRILRYIPANQPVSLEMEVFPNLLNASNERIVAVRQERTFFDIGTEESYKAFLEFASGASISRPGVN